MTKGWATGDKPSRGDRRFGRLGREVWDGYQWVSEAQYAETLERIRKMKERET